MRESTRWNDEILACSETERSQLPCLAGLAVKKLAFELMTLAVTAVGVSKTSFNASQQVAYSPRQEVART